MKKKCNNLIYNLVEEDVMKKLSILLIPVLIVSILFAQPQESEEMTWKQKTQLGLRVNGNYYLASLDENDYDGLISPGIGGYIDYRLAKHFSIGVGLEYNQLNIDYPQVLENNLIYAYAKGKLFLMRSNKFSPFLDGAVGRLTFTQENNPQAFSGNQAGNLLTGGLGAEISLSERIILTPLVEINTTIPDNVDFDLPPNKDHTLDDQYINFSMGISFKLGGPKKPEPKEEVEEEVEKPEEIAEEPEVEEEKAEQVEEKVEEVEEKAKEEIEKKYYEKLQYMIQPNDYLIKIAGNIYEDKSMWRDIYDWNREDIGDNPNLIYPFHELLLKDVPVDNIDELDYSFYNYEIKHNETLWSIAAKEYGNPYAWIIIYRDNKDILGDRMENLKAGNVIKLRDKIFNKE